MKYCAPELLQGRMATEKADVYSFGITMWQLIHEMTPFDKEDLHVVVYRVSITEKKILSCKSMNKVTETNNV